jgi:hypothetical protein
MMLTIQARLIKENGKDASSKHWEHTFRAAKRWCEMAERFGDSLIFYLPTANDVFSSTWYEMTTSDADNQVGEVKER